MTTLSIADQLAVRDHIIKHAATDADFDRAFEIQNEAMRRPASSLADIEAKLWVLGGFLVQEDASSATFEAFNRVVEDVQALAAAAVEG